MQHNKNDLDILDRAILVWRNPDDFDFGSFLHEEVDAIGSITIYILTGIDTRTRNRTRVLKYSVDGSTNTEELI